MEGVSSVKVHQNRHAWEKHHFRTVAGWIKEVALLFLASLVVQKLFTGGSLADPVVILGAVSAIILYGFATHLLLRS